MLHSLSNKLMKEVILKPSGNRELFTVDFTRKILKRGLPAASFTSPILLPPTCVSEVLHF